MSSINCIITGIFENKTASVHLIDEKMVMMPDYVGLVSGAKTDKSTVFDYEMGLLNNTPIIKNAPISMECQLIDVYETDTQDNFILKVIHTHVNEDIIVNGYISYEKFKPILFEKNTRSYLSTGEKIANCWSIGKQYNNS